MKKLALTLSFIVGIGFATMAQPGGGSNGDGSSTGGNSLGGSAPIDGGVSMLLILGAAVAGRKIYQYKKAE